MIIKTADLSLNCTENKENIGFREKVELAKQLDKLGVDVIELGGVGSSKSDAMLNKTIASAVTKSTLSFPVSENKKETEETFLTLKDCKNIRARVSMPVSAVQMEYLCGKKPDAVLSDLKERVAFARCLCSEVEFVAIDALRSDEEFLKKALGSAAQAGASVFTLCDSAETALPDEVATVFSVAENALAEYQNTVLGFQCTDGMGMGCANIFAAIKSGCTLIKTALHGNDAVNLRKIANALYLRGSAVSTSVGLDVTRLNDSVLPHSPVNKNGETAQKQQNDIWHEEDDFVLSSGCTAGDVTKAILSLGYELDEADKLKVYEAVSAMAKNKKISSRELEAIIASEAMQVEQTYRLISYVSNSGNIINSTANIILEKNGKQLSGLCMGDGPIDAAFLAIEKIIGTRYELDDFQIRAVTEGKEAMGEAVVKLRSNKALYSGRGISTDIIAASIRAYLNAINKITYEEGNK